MRLHLAAGQGEIYKSAYQASNVGQRIFILNMLLVFSSNPRSISVSTNRQKDAEVRNRQRTQEFDDTSFVQLRELGRWSTIQAKVLAIYVLAE